MSSSRRALRMLGRHMRHKAEAELNLIPMIDILSVMVSFLLVYSTEVEVLPNTKAIQIPESIAKQRPHESVVVMITPDELLLQGEPIASLADVRASQSATIEPLTAALQRPLVAGSAAAAVPIEDREITIMGDKTLPYEVLKKVMATCTAANYGKISLAVLQKEKALAPGSFKPL
jgi:biopolymer transport protein TolR